MSAHRSVQIPVWCVGASYRTAPLELLERLSRAEGNGPIPLMTVPERLRSAFPDQAVVVLSTCNRVELYWSHGRFLNPDGGVCPFPIFSEAEVAELLGIDLKGGGGQGATGSPIYQYRGVEACRHLYEVAAGLDSLVPGEHQILGQVGAALRDAEERWGDAGSDAAALLRELFVGAVRSARRVRSTTGIARGSASVGAVAVDLARAVLGELAGRSVVVVGAGETAVLTVEALSRQGVTAITVLNRSLDHAATIARRFHARAATLTELRETMHTADILITATGSPSPVITLDDALSSAPERGHRPLVVIDLAMPRDVDRAVSGVPGFHLFDLEELREHSRRTLDQRLRESPRANEIIRQELAALGGNVRAIAVRPVLAAMWTRANAIRDELLAAARSRNGDLGSEHWEQIDAITRALVNKILHEPSQKLRSVESHADLIEYARAVELLFGSSFA